jgi:7-cyano-7-deazaguanine synthase in queuosine biosynthesis
LTDKIKGWWKTMHDYFENKENFVSKVNRARGALKGQNVVLSFSGGLDSTGAIAVLKYLGADKILPVFFDRGQSNRDSEIKAAFEVTDIASKLYPGSILELEIERHPIPSKEFKEKYRTASTKNRYDGRNVEMAVVCRRIAKSRSDTGWEAHDGTLYSIVSNGNVMTDKSFGDGSPAVYHAMNRLSTALDGERKLTFFMPFLRLDLGKSEAFGFALDCSPEFAEALNSSYSCWEPDLGDGPCDACLPCEERAEAYRFAQDELGLELLI